MALRHKERLDGSRKAEWSVETSRRRGGQKARSAPTAAELQQSALDPEEFDPDISCASFLLFSPEVLCTHIQRLA